MLGEELYALSQYEDYNWKMYDGRGGFTEQGEGFVDAMLSSLPAGDLLPEEILAPKDLSFNNEIQESSRKMFLSGEWYATSTLLRN